ncbi:hypothetical protein [Kitasatospora sp. NPDC058190]|uniref:hypothetical protein n=1 Tax=Kitasatospora sp. NPDC058190 TaxID=3346371 RepID=UPI0036DF907F
MTSPPPLARLTETDKQRTEVRQWLWRVVIADGTHALTSAGRWSDALRHIEEHRGIGRRILDGRRTAILAATTGDLAGALTLPEDTEPGDPWEDAVTAVLTALCRPGERHAADAAIGHCLIFEPNKGLTVFTTRLALTALDAADPGTPAARNLLGHLTNRTSESGDGYALRDLLTQHGARDHLEPGRATALEQALAACALGSTTMPTPVHDRLEDALGRAAKVLENSPFDPGSPRGDPLERRTRSASSSDTLRPQIRPNSASGLPT